MQGTRVLVLANSSWNITNFRMGLLAGLKERGCDIIVATPPGAEVMAIQQSGFRFRPLFLNAKGRNPLADLRTIVSCLKAILTEKPDLVMTFTVKPNVYGGLAARIVGVPLLPNIAGLGAAFSGGRALRLIATLLYKTSLKKASLAFFQNREDRAMFVEQEVIDQARTHVLPGSGVDTDRFPALPLSDGPVRFGMIARLVADKGVREFVEAARQVKTSQDCEFVLAGFLEPQHGRSITCEEIDAWEQEGILRYLGPLDDVRPVLAGLHCLVLPSYYREGTPRSLLEAASMARALITTDHPGCRDTVDSGVSGLLVTPRDSTALAEAMDAFCGMRAEERREMGCAGRRKVETQFAEQIIVEAYASAIQRIKKERLTTCASRRKRWSEV